MQVTSQVRLKDSIATKLLGYVFSIYLVVSVIVTAVHMVSEYRRVETNVNQDLKTVYFNSNPTMALAFWEADRDQINSILDGMVRSPVILGVKINDMTGKYERTVGETVEAEDELHAGEKGDPGIRVRKRGVGDLFGYRFPIVYSGADGNRPLGSMTIYSSPSVIFSRVKYSYLFIVFNAIFKTIVLWVVFLWFSRFLLRRPLSILTTASREIGLDNLDNVRIDVKTSGRNELKVLEESFNAMIGKLRDARNKLAETKEAQNRRLEKLVAERTRELSESEK
ncbi:MAG: hypothetical protein MI892_06945, partial [Desulfobacterales bacterium]|nr:hypothetical protein [Desulfobacterales bacterium]